MKHLVFSGAERVRPAEFVERSLLPVSAACIVANAIRERLATLSRAEVDLRLWPPAIPRADAWDAILRDARVYVIRGARADAAIVLRPHDANALAALLFGESEASPAERALSPIESEITRRAVAALASSLAAVCGETRVEESSGIDAVTYFELHVLAPVAFCIGIALSREPQAGVARKVQGEAILAALFTVSVELPLRLLRAEQIAGLKFGDVLEADSPRATLRANGEIYARGACGVSGDRFAMRLIAIE